MCFDTAEAKVEDREFELSLSNPYGAFRNPILLLGLFYRHVIQQPLSLQQPQRTGQVNGCPRSPWLLEGSLADLSRTSRPSSSIACSHTLCEELQTHTSARYGRMISFRAKTSRFHSSFLLAVVRLSNVPKGVGD